MSQGLEPMLLDAFLLQRLEEPLNQPILLRRVWRDEPFRRCYGSEYVSHKLTAWAKKQRIDINYIQPGKPQQNAYVERYNRTIRYDWLSHYLFESIAEVQDFATRWLWTYNNERPNMALGGITPKQKVAMAA